MRQSTAGIQQRFDALYDATTQLTGSAAQLVLPRNLSRSFLMIQNLGTHSMAVEVGCARATATLTSGVVSSLTVTNAGFGFKYPPIVELLGGGYGGNTAFSPVGMIDYPAPQGGAGAQVGGVQAQVAAVLSGGAVSSFTILNGGSNYAVAPYVLMRNDDRDPFGAALPALTSAGFLLAAGSSPIILDGGGFCPTDPVSVIGTANDYVLIKWAN